MRRRIASDGGAYGGAFASRSLPRLSAALLAAALALVAAWPAAAQVSGGIHITRRPEVGKISGSTVTITWTTDKARAGSVQWGDSRGHYKGALSESVPTKNHTVRITGLARNTTYHYKVKTGSAKSRDRAFMTADYDDTPFTFANMGDNRGDSIANDTQHVTPGFQNVVDAATAKAPAFTVHVGDMFVGDTSLANTQMMYDVFKAAIQPLVSASAFTQYPFTVSPGNHEMRPGCSSLETSGEESCAPAFDPFQLFNQELPNQPQNGPQGYVGTTFSFDYGNTHIASIDACRFDANATTADWDLYHLDDEVITWLDADLTAAQQAHVRHIFVFGHPEAWAPDGVRWSVGSSGSQADLYAAVNHLAVGSGGTILASQDGVTWTPQASGTAATLREVAEGPVLVAVGDGERRSAPPRR
ncbi:MAG: metallophosphoesterase family protein [Acidobacteriota bacterium]